MSNLRLMVNRSRNLIFTLTVVSLSSCGSDDEQTNEQSNVDSRFATAESLIEYYNTFDRTVARDRLLILDLYYSENQRQEKLLRLFRSAYGESELRISLKNYFGKALEEYTWEEVLREPMPTDIKESPPPRKWPPAKVTEHNGDRAIAVQGNPYMGDETFQLVKVGSRWWISGYTDEYQMTDISDEYLDRQIAEHEKNLNARQQLQPRLLAGEFKTPRAYFDELYRLLGEPPPHARR